MSGPTAAFVVILFPIVQQYGLAGLLIAPMMAGLILILMGIARMGTLIEFVPYPVVLGLTAAIARTATSIRSGAVSPIAATVHALVALFAVMALARLPSLVPSPGKWPYATSTARYSSA